MLDISILYIVLIPSCLYVASEPSGKVWVVVIRSTRTGTNLTLNLLAPTTVGARIDP